MERVRNGWRALFCSGGDGVGKRRGDHAPGEDRVVMVVPRGGVDFDFAARRASHEDGYLAVEIDGLFDYAGTFAEGFPGSAHLGFNCGGRTVEREADFALAAAVVASGGALAEAFSAECGYGFAEFVDRAHGAVDTHGQGVSPQPIFLLRSEEHKSE